MHSYLVKGTGCTNGLLGYVLRRTSSGPMYRRLRTITLGQVQLPLVIYVLVACKRLTAVHTV
jgi:hypothetical protein